MENKMIKISLPITEPELCTNPINAVVLSILGEDMESQAWIYKTLMEIEAGLEPDTGNPYLEFYINRKFSLLTICPYLACNAVRPKFRKNLAQSVFDCLEQGSYVCIRIGGDDNKPNLISERADSFLLIYGYDQIKEEYLVRRYMKGLSTKEIVNLSDLEKIWPRLDKDSTLIKRVEAQTCIKVDELFDCIKGFLNSSPGMVSPKDGTTYFGLEAVKWYSQVISTSIYRSGEMVLYSVKTLYEHAQLVAGVVQYLELCGNLDCRIGAVNEAYQLEKGLMTLYHRLCKYAFSQNDSLLERIISAFEAFVEKQEVFFSHLVSNMHNEKRLSIFVPSGSYQSYFYPLKERLYLFLGSRICFQMQENEQDKVSVYIDDELSHPVIDSDEQEKNDKYMCFDLPQFGYHTLRLKGCARDTFMSKLAVWGYGIQSKTFVTRPKANWNGDYGICLTLFEDNYKVQQLSQLTHIACQAKNRFEILACGPDGYVICLNNKTSSMQLKATVKYDGCVGTGMCMPIIYEIPLYLHISGLIWLEIDLD